MLKKKRHVCAFPLVFFRIPGWDAIFNIPVEVKVGSSQLLVLTLAVIFTFPCLTELWTVRGGCWAWGADNIPQVIEKGHASDMAHFFQHILWALSTSLLSTCLPSLLAFGFLHCTSSIQGYAQFTFDAFSNWSWFWSCLSRLFFNWSLLWSTFYQCTRSSPFNSRVWVGCMCGFGK